MYEIIILMTSADVCMYMTVTTPKLDKIKFRAVLEITTGMLQLSMKCVGTVQLYMYYNALKQSC